MEKVLTDKIEKWKEASNTVTEMYIKLIGHEQDDNLDEEYEAIKYLLSKAIEFENKAFDDMNITPANFDETRRMIAIDHQYELEVEQGNIIDIGEVRRSRFFYNNILSLSNYETGSEIAEAIKRMLAGIFDSIYSTSVYESVLEGRIRLNQISIIEDLIKTIKEEKLKLYLIYLKYFYISTNPLCEDTWMGYRQKILPTINILTNFPTLPTIDELSLLTRAKLDIIREIQNRVSEISDINDFEMNSLTNGFYIVTIRIKALLVSFQDISFINYVETIVDEQLKDSIIYTQIKIYIKNIFEEARELVKKELNRQKRRTKKNGK
ncbi:MAG: hypothetical protein J1F35_04190 [Erysipelotrichales bacterium]|nr:hypothetical protein [Erysipelotrichales bacterium]